MYLLAATIVDKAISLSEIGAILGFAITLCGCLWGIVDLTHKFTKFTLQLSTMDKELVRSLTEQDKNITKGFSRVTDAWKIHQSKIDTLDNRINDLEEHGFIKTGFRKRRYNDNSGDLNNPDSY